MQFIDGAIVEGRKMCVVEMFEEVEKKNVFFNKFTDEQKETESLMSLWKHYCQNKNSVMNLSCMRFWSVQKELSALGEKVLVACKVIYNQVKLGRLCMNILSKFNYIRMDY